MSKEIILIKLGGSVITHKEIPSALNQAVLTRLAEEISRARTELPDVHFLVGHGHGSFGHVPASHYRTKEGFINDESPLGMAAVLDSVNELHQIVIHEFLKQEMPAVPFRLNSALVTRQGQAGAFQLEVLEQYLTHNLLPVTCGDVMVDDVQGCSLWSTEEVLNFLAGELQAAGWRIRSIVHVTDVAGVLDDRGQLVERLTADNSVAVQAHTGKAKGFDVSGGMKLKVEQSLLMAATDINSYIISGLRPNNLFGLLTEQDWVGTLVSAK